MELTLQGMICVSQSKETVKKAPQWCRWWLSRGCPPHHSLLAFSCSVFLEAHRKEGALLTGWGSSLCPGRFCPGDPAHVPGTCHMGAVSDPRWLGSPELWKTPCCFSPRLCPWLRSNRVTHCREEGKRQGDIWSLG